MFIGLLICMILCNMPEDFSYLSNKKKETIKTCDSKNFTMFSNIQNINKINYESFKSLDSWIDNEENIQNLINRIMYNNLRYSSYNMCTIVISNIYQYSLYKRTLFRTIATKSLINNMSKQATFSLKDFEFDLTSKILNHLTEVENYIFALKNINKYTLYNNYLNDENASLYMKMIVFRREIVNYINKFRRTKYKDFDYNVLFEYDKEMLMFLLIKYHISISSMIEIYCRTMFIIEDEKIKELIELNDKDWNKKTNDMIDFGKSIRNIYHILNELSSIISYNTDKYNRFINNNLDKLKNKLDYTFCLISSKNFTDIALKNLSDIKILNKKKKEKNNISYFFYYLSNRRDKNKIDFTKTKENMLKCCLTEFPKLKILTINLKSFHKFKSVLDYIKIAIEIDIELLRDVNENNPLVYSRCRLIPITTNIENFDDDFKNQIYEIQSLIKKFDKKIKIKYNQHKNYESQYSFNKTQRSYDIIDQNNSLICKCFLEDIQMYEILKLSAKVYEKCSDHGELSIYSLNITITTEYYNVNDIISCATKTKTYQLIPIYELSPKDNTGKKTYFYCYYLHNPEIRVLQHKSNVAYDLINNIFKVTNIKNIIFNTENFITDWFEPNILYSNIAGGFYNIVPFKYVSVWMAYITFRAFLHNDHTLTKENIEYLYNIIKRYEVNSMALDPVYFVQTDSYQNFIKESKCLFWSDKYEELNEKHEMHRIIKICNESLNINLFTHKIQFLINNKDIGLNDIIVISANPGIPNISKILKNHSSLIYYTVRKEAAYESILDLVMNSSSDD